MNRTTKLFAKVWILALGALLCLFSAAALFMLGASPARAAVTHTPSQWSDLKEAVEEKIAEGNGSVRLMGDCVGPYNNKTYIEVKGDVTLDLNGFVIDRNPYSAVENGFVFLVKGSLTITDSDPTKVHAENLPDGGVITGGWNSTDTRNTSSLTAPLPGGGIAVAAGGRLDLQGGSIYGNEAARFGGGVYLANYQGAFETKSATFTMSGGFIQNNIVTHEGAASGDGGGVFNGGSFTMSGGEISGHIDTNGGAVYNGGSFTMSGGKIIGNADPVYSADGKLTMTGGEISNNTGSYALALGGGNNTISGGKIVDNACVGLNLNGYLDLSGDAQITGNTKDGKPCNVLIRSDDRIAVTGAYTGQMGLSFENTPTAETSLRAVKISAGGSIGGAAFTADDTSGKYVLFEEGNYLKYGLPAPIVDAAVGGTLYIDGGLSDVSLVNAGTAGAFQWNAKQDIVSGAHDYGWTFTPTDTNVYRIVSGTTNLTAVDVASLEFSYTHAFIGDSAGKFKTYCTVTATYGDDTKREVSGYLLNLQSGAVLKAGDNPVTVEYFGVKNNIAVSASQAPVTVSTNGTLSNFADIGKAFAAANAASSETLVTLYADVTADAALCVERNRTIVLDLNGHVLDRGLREAAADGCVLVVKGKLTLTDSAPTATHADRGADFPAGGVVTGGYTTENGGGAFVSAEGDLAMEGGAIYGNRAAKYGGGVYSESSLSAFAVNGGKITGNTAGIAGGGAAFDLIMTVTGGAEIFGNTAGGTASNVYVSNAGGTDSHYINIAGNFTGKLGVSSAKKPANAVNVTVVRLAAGATLGSGAALFSDDDLYKAVVNADTVDLVFDLIKPTLNVVAEGVLYTDRGLSKVTIRTSEGDTAGVVRWDKPDQIVTAGTRSYAWTFVPENADYYREMHGEIELTAYDPRGLETPTVAPTAKIFTSTTLEQLKNYLTVQLSYNYQGEQTQLRTLEKSEYTLSLAAGDALQAGDNLVTAAYGAFTAQFTVHAAAVARERITADFAQGEQKFYLNDSLDSLKAFLTVACYNNDGSLFSSKLADGDYELALVNGSGFVVGANVVEVMFADLAPVTFTVEVSESAVTVKCGETLRGFTEISDAFAAVNADTSGQEMLVTLYRDFLTNKSLLIETGRNVTLDLNGHVLDLGGAGGSVLRTAAADSEGNGSLLTIEDSAPQTKHADRGENFPDGGVVTGGKDYSTGRMGGGVYVDSFCSFIMNGGTIYGNTANTGGGVYLSKNSAFTLNGGAIIGNTAAYKGGGVYAEGTDRARVSVSMNGGTIAGNVAEKNNAAMAGYGGGLYLYCADFTLTGGEIENNSAIYGYGAGAYLSWGYAEMTGGKIRENHAGARGGGVFLTNNANFTLRKGEIEKNDAEIVGGGVCVGEYNDSARFTMTGGKIRDNASSSDRQNNGGAGVYATNVSTLNLYGGEITGNHIDLHPLGACGAGVYAYNAGASTNGKVTLNIKGDVVISGNYAEGLIGGPNNLYLGDNSDANKQTIVNVAGAFTGTLGFSMGKASSLPKYAGSKVLLMQIAAGAGISDFALLTADADGMTSTTTGSDGEIVSQTTFHLDISVADGSVYLIASAKKPTVGPIAGTMYEGAAMPSLTLGEGDTAGTIEWFAGQSILSGTNQYLWVFTPQSSAYRAIKGKLTLTAVALTGYELTLAEGYFLDAYSTLEDLAQYIAFTAQYADGAAFEMAGGSLTLAFKDAAQTKFAVGANTMTATFCGIEHEFDVQVSPELSEIRASFDGSSPVYTSTSLNALKARLTVTGVDSLGGAYADDFSTCVLSFAEGATSLLEGKNTIAVTFEKYGKQFTASFEVTALAVAPARIEAVYEQKKDHFVSDSLESFRNELIVTGFNNDGSVFADNIAEYALALAQGDTLVVGDNAIEVTYQNFQTTFIVVIGEPSVIVFSDGAEKAFMAIEDAFASLADYEDGAAVEIVLYADFVHENGNVADAWLSVPIYRIVTLDLNGHILDRNMTETKNNAAVLYAHYGQLTIVDSNPSAVHEGREDGFPQGGVITGAKSSSDGGGIRVSTGSLTLNGGTVYGNSAKSGGGIYAYGTVTIGEGSAILNNTAAERGGGLYVCQSEVTMNGGKIGGNVSNGRGGGVSVYGTSAIFVMNGGSIVKNKASKSYEGGGVAIMDGGKFIFENGTISENQALHGGGVAVLSLSDSSAYDPSSMEMTNGVIGNNKATKNGGGVYLSGIGTDYSVKQNNLFTMRGGEICNNMAEEAGGGVFVGKNAWSSSYYSARFELYGGTISGNGANNSYDCAGGGVHLEYSCAMYLQGGAVVGENVRATTKSVTRDPETGRCTGGASSNVVLPVQKDKSDTAAKIYIDGAFTGSIGVTKIEVRGGGYSPDIVKGDVIWLTRNGTVAENAALLSDKETYVVKWNDSTSRYALVDGPKSPAVNVQVTQNIYMGEDLNGVPVKILSSDASGAVSWEAGQSVVAGKHAYRWVFTPDDTEKWRVVYGSIELTAVEIESWSVQFDAPAIFTSTLLESLREALAVTVRYADGREKTLAADEYTLSFPAGQENFRAGENTVTLSYGGSQYLLTVSASAVELQSLNAVFDAGETTVYDSFGYDELRQYLTVTGVNNDGTAYNGGAKIEDYTISGTISAGEQTLFVVCGNAKGKFTVTFAAAALSGITAEFDAGGRIIATSDTPEELFAFLTVVATYADGRSKEVTDYELSVDTLREGTYDVTVTFGGKSDTFSLTVVKDELTEILVTAPDKTEYAAFEDFDAAGMIVTAAFSVSGRKVVANYEIAGGESLRFGMDHVTVQYSFGGVTKAFDQSITVAKIDYDMRGVTFESAEKEYTGQAMGLEIGGPLPVGKDGAALQVVYDKTGTDAGEYTVTASFIGSENYNAPANMQATLTVLPKLVEISWSANDFIYNGKDRKGEISAAYTNVNGEIVALAISDGEFCHYREGGYLFTADFANGERNYTLPEQNSKSYDIKKAALIVTANDSSITYGEEPRNGGASFTGFAGSEDEKVLTGSLSFAIAYSRFDDAGAYGISLSGISANDYTIEFQSGILTVCEAPVTVTIENKRTAEGKALAALTAVVSAGTVFDGDILQYSLETAADASEVGTSAITGVDNDGNYAITFVNASYEVYSIAAYRDFIEAYGNLLEKSLAALAWSDVSEIAKMAAAHENLNADNAAELTAAQIAKIAKLRELAAEIESAKTAAEHSLAALASVTAQNIREKTNADEVESAIANARAKIKAYTDLTSALQNEDLQNFSAPASADAALAAYRAYETFAKEYGEAYNKDAQTLSYSESAAVLQMKAAFNELSETAREVLREEERAAVAALYAKAERLQETKEAADAALSLLKESVAAGKGKDEITELLSAADEKVANFLAENGLTGDLADHGAILLAKEKICEYETKEIESEVQENLGSLDAWTDEKINGFSMEQVGELQSAADKIGETLEKIETLSDLAKEELAKTKSWLAALQEKLRGKLELENAKISAVEELNAERQRVLSSAAFTASAKRKIDAYYDGAYDKIVRLISLAEISSIKAQGVAQLNSVEPLHVGWLVADISLALVLLAEIGWLVWRGVKKGYITLKMRSFAPFALLAGVRAGGWTVGAVFFVFLLLAVAALGVWIADRILRDRGKASVFAPVTDKIDRLLGKLFFRKKEEPVPAPAPVSVPTGPIAEETKQADIRELIRETVTAEEAKSALPDEIAATLMDQSGPQVGRSRPAGKKAIVNVDELSETFAAGESVTLQLLKDKGLVPQNAAFVKVLARGALDKPLTVEAQDFSLDAVKMIVLTGGKAVKIQ